MEEEKCNLPTREELSYFRPLITVLLMSLENHLFFVGAYRILFNFRIEVVMPSLEYIRTTERGRIRITFHGTVCQCDH